MEVICIETEAFFSLIERVIEHFNQKRQETEADKWIDKKEVMNLLGIKSATTLQRLRDEGKIRFSQPMRRVIKYDRDSVLEYLERNAKDTF